MAERHTHRSQGGGMSKSRLVVRTAESIMQGFIEYAFFARDWDIKSEGDYEDLLDVVERELEGLVDMAMENSIYD